MTAQEAEKLGFKFRNVPPKFNNSKKNLEKEQK